MSRYLWWILAGALAIPACADPAMNQRVTDLENKVAAIEKKATEAEAARPAARPTATPEQEEAAGGIAKQIQAATEGGDTPKALELCKSIDVPEYAATRAARGMKKACQELALVGADAGQLDVEKWYQGKAAMGDGKATMLVFFESWCPHCKKEVPELQKTYEKYGSKGLNIIGLTKVTKSATDDAVMALLKDNGVKYPVAKETGALSERFKVQGIPAAAVVVDGKVVWRGHPARLTDAMIEGWLK